MYTLTVSPLIPRDKRPRVRGFGASRRSAVVVADLPAYLHDLGWDSDVDRPVVSRRAAIHEPGILRWDYEVCPVHWSLPGGSAGHPTGTAPPHGFATVLWVVGVYILIEIINDHVILPLLNWHAIWFPPALGIFSQVLLGALWSGLGVLLAMPLVATVIVLIKIRYMHNTLGESVELGDSTRARPRLSPSDQRDNGVVS